VADNERRTIHIPRDLMDHVRLQAERLDRSVSWVVRRALSVGLGEVEQLPSMARAQRPEAAE
jgi:uncharacterized small protein (TIGR04563 family)